MTFQVCNLMEKGKQEEWIVEDLEVLVLSSGVGEHKMQSHELLMIMVNHNRCMSCVILTWFSFLIDS